MSTSEIERLVWVRDAAQSGKARRLREANHLSLGDIAEATGNHETTVWKWETNQRRPSSSPAALRYADLLRTLESLHTGEPDDSHEDTQPVAEAAQTVRSADMGTPTAANAPPRRAARSAGHASSEVA